MTTLGTVACRPCQVARPHRTLQIIAGSERLHASYLLSAADDCSASYRKNQDLMRHPKARNMSADYLSVQTTVVTAQALVTSRISATSGGMVPPNGRPYQPDVRSGRATKRISKHGRC